MPKFYALEPHVNGTTRYAVGDEREVEDENEVKHLVDLKVLSTEKPKKGKTNPDPAGEPDYERDQLKDLDLKKANKDQLLVIAAYEGSEAKADATNADLIKAIEAKRKGA